MSLAGAVFWPWLDPRFRYYVDDGVTHALRLALFDHLLRRGEWFPRWWPDLGLGYGYPLLNYYSPGVYYLGEVFHLLGVSTYRALQLVAICSALLGAGGAFLLGAVLFRSAPAAVVLAGAYVGAPYPFVTNLYNRSAFPEALGLGVLPWLLTAAWLTVQRPSSLTRVGLAVALAVLVLVHSLTAMIGAGLLALWLGAALLDLPWARRRGGARAAVVGVGLGLALAAFFWLPALFEQGAVHTELGKVGNLSYERWLFDPLRPSPVEVDMAVPLPYHISQGSPIDLHWVYPHTSSGLAGPAKPSLAQAVFWIAGLLAGLLGLLEATRVARSDETPVQGTATQQIVRWDTEAQPTTGKETGRLKAVDHFRRVPVAVLVLCLALPVALWFLNTTWSAVLWQALSPLAVLQFPWRLYGAFSLTLACAGAGIFAWLARRGQPQWVLAALLVAFVVVNGRAGHTLEGRIGTSAAQPPPAAQLRAQENDRLATGTTSGGEFLPRSVVLAEPVDMSKGGRAAYETPYPSGGWIAGQVWPFAGRVDVEQVWEAPSWTAARVQVHGDGSAELAFRTLVFPGWRAYVDGRPASLRPAPFDAAAGIGHGFAIVPVPPGEHVVQLASGATGWRVLGTLLSVAGLGACTVILRRPLRSLLQRARPAGRESRPERGRRAEGAVTTVTLVVCLAYLASAAWPLWRAPHRLTDRSAAVVLDLARTVRQGQGAQISAPDGNARGAFVDVREQTLVGHRREWLYMHPPAQVAVSFDVPPRAVFQAGLGVDSRAWEEAGADGVRFVLAATDAQGTQRTLLDEVVQPQERAADRGWRFALVDLGAYAGQRITLTLRTEGRDTPLFDWAGWATPVVFVDRSGRYPPPAVVAPALQSAARVAHGGQ